MLFQTRRIIDYEVFFHDQSKNIYAALKSTKFNTV
jgi:hypothetical protein